MATEVHLIAGPARSGKTTRLLERYRRFLQSQSREALPAAGLWISPHPGAVAQVRDALAAASRTALLQPAILTFSAFAESLATRGERRIRPISPLQKRRLLQLVVDRAVQQRQLRHFRPVAKTPGFLAQLDELIAELKRRDVWPEDFQRRSRNQRDRELSILYDAYQRQLLASDLYDAEGRFWAARNELSRSKSRPTAPFGLVVVDGFSDFTATQYDVLRLLAEQTGEMHLSLTIEAACLEPAAQTAAARSVLFAKPQRTLQRLRQTFPSVTIETVKQSHFSQAALGHLERNLFRDPHCLERLQPSAGGPLEGVEIVAASSLQGEIEEIARRVKALLLTGQARPQEVVVVYRSLEGVATRLGSVFDDFGIPYAIETRPRLVTAPLVRALSALLRLQAQDWPFRLLLEVVGNRLFSRLHDESKTKNTTARATTQAQIVLERCIRAAQLPAGRQPLLKQLRQWAAAPSSPEQSADSAIEGDPWTAQAKQALAKLELLAQRLEALPEQASLAQWMPPLETLLAALGAVPTAGETSSASWHVLCQAMRSIAMLDAWAGNDRSALTVAELLELLQRVANQQRLPAEHDAVGRVRILSAESARTVSARHVLLAGLSEQSFPTAERTGRLYDENELRRLDPYLAAAGDASHDVESHSEAMLLFYEMATRASESLTLSYPAMDDKGQSLPPSPLLTELERCFGDQTVPRTTMPLGAATGGDAHGLSRSALRQQAVARALKGQQQWLAGLASRSAAMPVGRGILSAIECIASRGERNSFGPYEGILQSDAARAALAARFSAEHLWSPSQLESYATCPFRFFAGQLLSLEPLDNLVLRSDAQRRGSLLHQLLVHVQQQLREARAAAQQIVQPEEAELIELFQQALDKAVEAAPLSGLEQALREIERREIEAWAPRYAQQENQYRAAWSHLDQPPRPTYLEVRFGPAKHSAASPSGDEASTDTPFELDLGDQRIRIVGQIDRIDVGQVGSTMVFNVIDYKSGQAVKLRISEVLAGRQLQLPLYAMAAEQLLLADQQAQALTVGYWNIQDKGFHNGREGLLAVHEVDGQTLHNSPPWDELQPQLIDCIRQLVTNIRDGQFPVDNPDEDCTRWCPYCTLCRVAHIRSLAKGEGERRKGDGG